ncbi:MAG: DUF6470 family protein [Lachnospiraceae bacterium]|nr:DUF6470 family protein [Lachnospiraceae bacterium]
MEPLISITTIPISIEMKVNNARLEYKNSNATMEITRDSGGLRIKSQPIKLDIDQSKCFSSIRPTTMESTYQAAQKGKQAVYEATATYAQEGKLLLNAQIGEDVLGQIIDSRVNKDVNTNVGIQFLPSAAPELNWSAPEMTIEYEMDKLNFDWKVLNGNFEFIPGDIEISITQMPDVRIEYIGGPIYFPASADPDYVPTTDVRA